jgi:hypothetical protein
MPMPMLCHHYSQQPLSPLHGPTPCLGFSACILLYGKTRVACFAVRNQLKTRVRKQTTTLQAIYIKKVV